ncbi:Ferric reductase transmembrane component 3 [Grifola frondosa]|uniref:ferric-chelate reductase (NADPH) n=1 Tax=Grifola frondosa TaxID=5627 RepID=A0A1C7MLE4_GRIFR|nr:Ferric reductase transmembrane component 3 [Grifola frondosa]
MSSILEATAGAASDPQPVDDGALVFNVDVFLLCILAAVVLLLLPRAVIRYTHLREWTEGHLLRCIDIGALTPSRRPSRGVEVVPAIPVHISQNSRQQHDNSYSEKWGGESNESHTYVSHADLLRNKSTSTNKDLSRNDSTSSGKTGGPNHDLPTHMHGWSCMLPSLASFLRITIRPGLSLSQAATLLIYFAIMIYAGLYRSNPFTDPVRAGFVATSQVPVVIFLVTKNNVVGMLLGFGYEKLNYIHRFAGRLLVLALNIHAMGYFYKWSLAGTFQETIAKPEFTWGLVGLVAADLLYFFSLGFFRQKVYNSVFLTSHIVSAIILLVAMCLHEPSTVPYALTAAGLYGFDRLLRVIKTRYTTARLRPLPDLGMTRVEIPGINAGWRAGQHVRLRVLSLGMGWLGWAESHPFTIASVSRDPSGEGLVLLCKKAGGWTGRLYEVAQRADYGEANGLERNAKVLVEGPYGGPGHAIFASFSGAMFVVGGSGITFALAAVQDLVRKDTVAGSRVRAIELVWSVQDPASIGSLLPTFSSLLAQTHGAFTSLRISIFYTRSPSILDPLESFGILPPGLTISAGRPRMQKMLESVVDRSSALFSHGRERRRGTGALTGVIVGVCGPAGLGEDVRRAVGGFDPKRRSTVAHRNT